MIKKGDVYTYYLKDEIEKKLRACYRPVIIVRVIGQEVIAVPLTMNLTNSYDSNRVYTQMTVSNDTKPVCVLTDIPLRIQVKELIKRIAHVDGPVFDEIEQKTGTSEIITNLSQNQERSRNDKKGIVVTENIEDVKKILMLVEGMSSKRNIWKERMISFGLGIIASLIVTLIFA
ncbi:MAG: hypothetical protein MJZ11_06820 [Lachnospiraceae bacterium]|nr:hypothetical protein [Lachnospiraceae bacterium]